MSAPDATYQAISASCEIEHKSKDGTVLTRFVAMTDVVLIIYLFNYTETKARHLFIFVQRAYTDLHTTHGEHEAGAWRSSLSLATTVNSIHGLEDYTVHDEF